MEVRDPIDIRNFARDRPSTNVTVDKVLRRRHIVPAGEWHLWLHMCGWRVFHGSQEILHSESDRSIVEKTLRDEVDGKILERVTIDSANGASAFVFEDDVKIETWPIDMNDEQFLVFEESGSVFAYRGDGTFWCGPGTTKDDEKKWRRGEISPLHIYAN